MLDTLSILVNGITLALAFGILLIVLWYDLHKLLHQFFAIFLFMVLLWNTGALITQAAILVGADTALVRAAVLMMELGFSGSSVGIFAVTTVLVRAQTRSFRALAFLSLASILIYRLFVHIGVEGNFGDSTGAAAVNFQLQPLLIAFYLIFDLTTLYLLWQHRRKIRSQEIVTGISAFVLGQSLSFLNPDLQAFALSTVVSSLAALLTSFALLKQEIINPLTERMSQVEAVHRVSIAITSQISLDTVLAEISSQAVKWLRAEAAGIWLYRDGQLELATVHNLPAGYVSSRLALGQGVIGTVAQSHQTMHLEDYRRDWQGVQDLPLARETFGSIIAAPLTYRRDTIGVLLVIASREGRLFDRDDVYQLELLGAQAAVAIANSHLFEEQRAMAEQVEFSRSQMETVLSSTPSPVIAVSHRLDIIFANTAARRLLTSGTDKLPLLLDGKPIIQEPTKKVLRDLRKHGHYMFEMAYANHTYLTMITPLQTGGARGFVAIMNDISQLKELDRMKNEMVRMTSHDLKNPLQAALANLDLAKEELLDTPNPEIAQSLDVIEHQLSRMNRIIRGILDVERARTGMYTFVSVDPGALLHHAVDELQHLIESSRVSCSISVEEGVPQISGDLEQLKRAVVNLLENALKFTPPGGSISLSVNAGSSGVVISIADTGVGIPEHVGDRVFERFFRVNQSGTEHITGSGLGLSLVRTIIEQHQGRVWFTSQVGKGTTFFIELPISGEKISEMSQ